MTRRRKRTSTRGAERVAAFGLGGNVGSAREVEARLAAAVRGLAAALGPLAVAPLYRSLPRSPRFLAAQPTFLNTAVVAATDWEPEALLALAKALERAAGRRRGPRHGPRPLDIDLLLYGDRTTAAAELTLPHPALAVRRFVLAPLADLAPDLRVPPSGATVAELLAGVGQEDEIERIPWSDPAALLYAAAPESGTVGAASSGGGEPEGARKGVREG